MPWLVDLGSQQATPSEHAATVFGLPRTHDSIIETEQSNLSEDQRCSYATLLLAFGADAKRKGIDGLSAGERAKQQGQFCLARYLQHWGGDQIRVLGRTSSFLAERASVHTNCVSRLAVGSSLRPRAGMAPPGSGQAGLELVPDVLFARICEALVPSAGVCGGDAC